MNSALVDSCIQHFTAAIAPVLYIYIQCMTFNYVAAKATFVCFMANGLFLEGGGGAALAP